MPHEIEVYRVQAHSLEEVEDFIGIANCLLVNMGTLDPSWLSSMQLCAKRCVQLQKPWVLDPVGAGELLFCFPSAQLDLSLT
jgi:hydroxyethylthiazole kinase-like sugar kinase family protein